MAYSNEQVALLQREHNELQVALDELLMQCVLQGDATENPRAKEHMLHGAARRLKIMARALGNIYEIYPPSNTRVLSKDSLSDLQINLHAFVINLYGVFENWAWSFVALHGLEGAVGGRMKIGVFSPATQRYFPDPIRSYVEQQEIKRWFEEYLKNYRDALAHRIPLYVPPAAYTLEQGDQYKALELEKMDCIRKMQWKRLDEIWEEQRSIGMPTPMFLHSFSEREALKPVYMHPQLISDGKSVIEFGSIYLENWRNRA